MDRDVVALPVTVTKVVLKLVVSTMTVDVGIDASVIISPGIDEACVGIGGAAVDASGGFSPSEIVLSCPKS